MAIVANLMIDQGSDFVSVISVEELTGNPADLTQYTARGQIRKTYSSLTAVTFSCGFADTDAQSRGEITVSLTAAQTGGMKAGRYVYDVEIVSTGGTVTRVVEGQVEIMPRVTQ